MRTFAITGTVAAGKSTVARLFEEWGATRLDADAIVRELQQPGTSVHRDIVNAFGHDIVASDGTLDRAKLRSAVLTNETRRLQLEAIVHPAVERRRRELLAEAVARGDRIVVAEIPLLFEAADPGAYDGVIVVDAPLDVRRRRLVVERGLEPDVADRLMAAQWSADRKRDGATWIINNDGSKERLLRRARAVWLEMSA